MGNSVTSAPSDEPVVAADVVAHSQLPIPTTAESTQITRMIQSARETVEDQLWISLITQTRVQTLSDWPTDNRIELSFPPLQSVTSVTYLDTDGVRQTLSTSIYDVTTNEFKGLVTLAFDQVFPFNRGDIGSIEVTYVAGYGDAATDVPSTIQLALVQIVADWWEHREEHGTGTIVFTIPGIAMRALDQYSRRELV
ncbi:hypothetical protein LCGC14_0583330 [marine sediment metagenome]|uniref:Phage gp6-like head-tail connector protein n=1 Tax=marine sediment metagenome TaxID=412755 RepID=A0A0F9UP08_9ZZZZ